VVQDGLKYFRIALFPVKRGLSADLVVVRDVVVLVSLAAQAFLLVALEMVHDAQVAVRQDQVGSENQIGFLLR